MSQRLQIPFYLNEKITDNLYTVLIEKFSKIDTVTNRKQSIINITTPLCNVMDGKYIDGDLQVQFLNEFARQRTEERVSIGILIFLKAKQMLEEQDLIKKINDSKDIEYLKKDDYVELNCKINKNPLIEYAEENLKNIQMQMLFMPKSEHDLEYKNKKDLVKTLKEYFSEHTQNNCLRYITEDFTNSKTKFVIPLEKKYMSASLEYLEDGEATIFGKIINIGQDNNKKNKIAGSNTCFDYLKQNLTNNIDNKYFNKLTINNFVEEDIRYIEILPICIYI